MSTLLRNRYAPKLGTLAAFVLIAWLLPYTVGGYAIHVVDIALVFALLAIGMGLAMGIAGQINLAQIAFFGVSAYATAILTTHNGLGFWPAAALAEPAATEHLDALPIWLSWTQVIPGANVDPSRALFPRRRPGHPPVVITDPDPQNPTAIDPAPFDAVGAFVPLPDRWRIMEALGFQYPWYDPYNQNIWKGDKPMKIPGLDGDDWFFSLLGISDTIVVVRDGAVAGRFDRAEADQAALLHLAS